MAVYNDSFMQNVTNPVDIIAGMGQQLQGFVPGVNEYLFGYLILLTFFILFLTMALRYPLAEVLLIDSFLTTIIAILLYGTSGYTGSTLISGVAIVIPVIVFALTLIFYLLNR